VISEALRQARSEAGRKGALAALAAGTAHRWTPETARVAAERANAKRRRVRASWAGDTRPLHVRALEARGTYRP
jgi:hypothetical protein